MNKLYKFQRIAAIDLILAELYTLEHFDAKQWVIYKKLLLNSIQNLANSDQKNIPDYYVYSKTIIPFILVGGRKIFFKRINDLLIIRRIIHYRADITPDLFENDDDIDLLTI